MISRRVTAKLSPRKRLKDISAAYSKKPTRAAQQKTALIKEFVASICGRHPEQNGHSEGIEELMINDLSAPKTATFFVIKRNLSNRAVEELFTSLRAAHHYNGNNIFKHVRQLRDDAFWSAICFQYQATPSFFAPRSKITENLCGYLMLVEYKQYVAVFASRLGLTSTFKTKYLSPVPTSQIEGAIAKQESIFKKMRMRNMSVSPHAMRSKTLEAANLANVVGPAGSRRYAPQTYTVDLSGFATTATPSTGRISVRSNRVGKDEIIEFAQDVINTLEVDDMAVSSFIRNFARPMNLSEALTATEPTSLAIDTTKLIEDLESDTPRIRLVHTGDELSELTTGELQDLIDRLEKAFEIRGRGPQRQVCTPNGGKQVASIRLNKNRISLRSLDLDCSLKIGVETVSVPLGQDPDRQLLHQYLNANSSIIVLFDDPRLAYIDGTLFRDETLLDGGATFLSHFQKESGLSQVTSEKGHFTAAQEKFDTTSSFGIIVDSLASHDSILLCDDLDDEWADFIGIRNDGGLTHISFYHAKHGKPSLGAGTLHVAVSQAIKNLGNMTFPSDLTTKKIQRWSTTYNAPGQRTQIPRTIRSDGAPLEDSLSQARLNPNSIRHAVIVTSSISKQSIANEFNRLKKGERPKPHFVQLYWLLQSFISACSEVGASGRIVCQP